MQLGMVLERYDDAIVTAITSPITGIARVCKFPPSIAEIVEWCDEEVTRRERIRRLGELRLDPRARVRAENFANLLVLVEAPQHAAMLERAKTADAREWKQDEHGRGIWVSVNWLK